MFEHKNQKEKIICAAIWYKDLPTMTLLPVNIDRGIVICGYRHGYIINAIKVLTNLRTVRLGENSVGESVQGFLTNKNRFLDRKEAHELFKKNGSKPEYEDELYSEDLY